MLEPGAKGGRIVDQGEYWNHYPVTEVKMACGLLMNRLRLRFGCKWSPWTSSSTESCPRPELLYHNVTLSANERITSVWAIYNEKEKKANSLQMKTNLRYLPRCGTFESEREKNMTGSRLLYLSGRADCKLDVLRLHLGNV